MHLVPTPRLAPNASANSWTESKHFNDIRNLIAREYLRTWFIVDFVSTIPLDTIFAKLVLNADALRGTKLIRMIRLVRLFKIFRLLKVRKVFRWMLALRVWCSCSCWWWLRGVLRHSSFSIGLVIRTPIIALFALHSAFNLHKSSNETPLCEQNPKCGDTYITSRTDLRSSACKIPALMLLALLGEDGT